jgi:hypothetical protein
VTTRPPHPGPPSPAHPSRSRQRRGDDNNVTIATAQLPQRCHWHCRARLAHTSSSSRPWPAPRPHPTLGAWPARLRACNGDVAMMMTRRLQPHYRHVVIVTAVLRCTHMHASYRSLRTTHACPPSLHIRKLPYTYAGFKNGDLSNHMFFLLFLCFLPIFHIICVYKYVVIYYGTLCEHGICVLKDSTGK